MKKEAVIPRKKRGPPATGKGEPIVVRMQPPQLQALDAWIAQQTPPFPSRPEAVRRLVEIGLTVNARPKQASRERADRAHETAGQQLDHLADKSASTEEQTRRKQKLLHGPEEFRGVRVDRSKKDKR